MRVRSVKIKNYRGYQHDISVLLKGLTVLVGKYDVGKSSILEAQEFKLFCFFC